MKVTTDTQDLLIVDDRPVLLGVSLGFLILVFVGIGLATTLSGDPNGLLFLTVGGGIGLLAFWAFVRRVQLVFHRPEGWVEFRRRNLFGGSKVRHKLSEIAGAEIEESSSSDGGETWRVVLVINEGQSVGRHPVTLAYSNGSGHQRCADAINHWLSAARRQATHPTRT